MLNSEVDDESDPGEGHHDDRDQRDQQRIARLTEMCALTAPL
ncbi:MAG TPA: hypothetical protein VF940_23770 [Streptosporangiaceae bacterium]